jgi:hypothetical protein
MKIRRLWVLALACGLVLALSSTALAQSPGGDAYGGVGASQEVQATNQVVTTSPSAESTGSLPFTGLDIGLVAIAGVGLGGLGFAIRRGLASRSD